MNFAIDIINGLLVFLIKPMLVIGIVLYVVNKPDFRSAAASHWLLLMAIFSPVFVVAFFAVFPGIDLNILPSSLAGYTQHNVFSPSESALAIQNIVPLLFAGLYFAGVLYVLGSMSVAILQARKMASSASRLNSKAISDSQHVLTEMFQVKKRVRILVSKEINAPMMCGFRSPVILLPEQFTSWTADRLLRVLAHEYAHIARNDWVSKVLGRCVCAVFWVNPLMWYAAKQSAWYAELACDDLVVSKLNCRAEYADDLLELSTDAAHQFAALAFIKKSELYQRIHSVLDGAKNRSAPGNWLKLVNVLCLLTLVLPVSLLQAKQMLAPITFSFKQVPHSVEIKEIEVQEPADSIDEAPRYISLEEINQRYKVSVSNALIENSVRVDTSIPQPSHTEMAVLTKKKPQKRVDFPEVKVVEHKPLYKHIPKYPRRALSRNIEGVVIVQMDLDVDGRVINPEIISWEPNRIFNRTALKAVEKFVYQPTTVNGKPIITKNVIETFVFKLEDATDTSLSYR